MLLALLLAQANAPSVWWQERRNTGLPDQRIAPAYNVRCRPPIMCALDGGTTVVIHYDGGPQGTGGTTVPNGCDAGGWQEVFNPYGVGGNQRIWVPSANCGDGGPSGGTPYGNYTYWLAMDGGLTGSVIMGSKGTGLVINHADSGHPTIYAGAMCADGQFACATSAVGALTCCTTLWSTSVTTVSASGDYVMRSSATGSAYAHYADATLPSCSNAVTSKLLYDTTSHAFTCGTDQLGDGGAGASGYTTVQEEGSSLTARTTLNLIGYGLTCVDNSGNSTTDCTLSKVTEAWQADASVTAQALAADPADCTSQQFAVGVAASGAATCGSLTCATGKVVSSSSGTLSCGYPTHLGVICTLGQTLTSIDSDSDGEPDAVACLPKVGAAFMADASITAQQADWTHRAYVADAAVAATTANMSSWSHVSYFADAAVALAADPANCASTELAKGVTANGTAECSAKADIKVGASFMADASVSADRLSGTPTLCSAGDYATGIDYNGNAACDTFAYPQQTWTTWLTGGTWIGRYKPRNDTSNVRIACHAGTAGSGTGNTVVAIEAVGGASVCTFTVACSASGSIINEDKACALTNGTLYGMSSNITGCSGAAYSAVLCNVTTY